MGALKQDRIARWVEAIEADGDGVLSELGQRIADGALLPEICRQKEWPYGKVLMWLMADADRYSVYLRALEVSGHMLVAESLPLADGVEESKDAIAKAKLQIDTRLKIASKHSKLYADKQDVNVNQAVRVEIVQFTEADVIRVAQAKAAQALPVVRERTFEAVPSEESVPSVGTAP